MSQELYICSVWLPHDEPDAPPLGIRLIDAFNGQTISGYGCFSCAEGFVKDFLFPMFDSAAMFFKNISDQIPLTLPNE